MMVLLTIASFLLATAGAVLAWWFVATYRKPPFEWRTYEAGRHLMYFTAGMAVILTWSAVALALRYLIGSPTWLVDSLAVVRVLIFGWAALMLWTRVRLLLKSRNEYRSGTTKDVNRHGAA